MGQLFDMKKIVFAYCKVNQKIKLGILIFHYEFLEKSRNGLKFSLTTTIIIFLK